MRDFGPWLRNRLERLLLWRGPERLLEIEFLDRSIALAGKAFVSFFPLVIVVAAFVPEGLRNSISIQDHGGLLWASPAIR